MKEKLRLEEEQIKIAELYHTWGYGNYYLGYYADAIKGYDSALKIQESVYGEEHPSTGITYNNLGIVYQELGEYEKALKYYQKAPIAFQGKLGPTHPHTKLAKEAIDEIERLQNQNSF